MATEYFAPQAIVHGVTVTPEGWMWILALALNDVPWAVEKASTSEFTAMVADYRRREKLYWLEKERSALHESLDRIDAQIAQLLKSGDS